MKIQKTKVEQILAKVRPFIQGHGGDVHLEKVEGDAAVIAVTGACVGCSLSRLTYDKLLGGMIREEIPSVKKVVFRYNKDKSIDADIRMNTDYTNGNY